MMLLTLFYFWCIGAMTTSQVVRWRGVGPYESKRQCLFRQTAGADSRLVGRNYIFIRRFLCAPAPSTAANGSTVLVLRQPII